MISSGQLSLICGSGWLSIPYKLCLYFHQVVILNCFGLALQSSYTNIKCFKNLEKIKIKMTYSKISFFHISGSELIIFYLCSGEKPETMDPDSFKLKNLQVVMILLTLVNLSILIYIQFRKMKMSMMDSETVVQSIRAYATDPHNKSDFLTVLFGTTALFLTTICLSYFNLVDPNLLNTYPKYLLLHAFRFGWPVFLSFIMICLGFYWKKSFSRIL